MGLFVLLVDILSVISVRCDGQKYKGKINTTKTSQFSKLLIANNKFIDTKSYRVVDFKWEEK